MTVEDLALLSRRDRVRIATLVAALVAVAVWFSLAVLHPAPPRRIVLASGPEFGMYHRYAQRYKDILGRQGVTVVERMTSGAEENLQLLRDQKSGVDIAFMQGGIVPAGTAGHLVMFASLYYEPLWIFYRGATDLREFNQLFDKRIAVGVPGSGTRALAEPLAKANGLLRGNTELVGLGGETALRALKAGEIDAAVYVGGAQTPLIQRALRDPELKLMSFARAEAYARQYPYIFKLTLPAGTIDLAFNLPDRDIPLIGTKAMLVGRDELHPALINLLVDAAREIHGEQSYFEAAGEFPGTAPVDLPVSPYADEHKRFGSSFLYRLLPFWVAAIVERTIIVVVPLLVVMVPVVNFVPQLLRERVRSRIYRWYGQLALMERDVATRKDALPIDEWLRELDRIEKAVEHIRVPPKFASEAYTLREHVALVRRAVLEKAKASAPGG
jgi:TRAP transporter TAXI family solute receptor